MKSIFNTDKRVRLGIWGLGRGAMFFKACEKLNIDVVAGCDFVKSMRDSFLEDQPGAFVTDNEDDFLASDINAVLVATYCPDHADHVIKCLEMGKHVLSEVTAFHTPAEGVRLVEAVEKSSCVYNFAENYPFSKERFYIYKKWSEGLFGKLIYGENEYNHDSRRPLTYTYLNKESVQPGWSLHAWRSWKHQHFYCTHSLGPLMHITGGRAVRVVSFAGKNSMAANNSQVKASGIATIASSLLTMDNGGVVRNFMGSTTNDTHQMRLWGTKGSVEAGGFGGGVQFRLGGKGDSPKMEVNPEWPELAELAEDAGHGGGDFWLLYFFAREILTGETAFWNVYRAAEVTLPGIFAYRSALENGKAFDIPDFSKISDRDAFRNDNDGQNRYDWEKGPFPENADKEKISDFTTVMSTLINKHATGARAAIDWLSIAEEMAEPKEIVPVLTDFVDEFEAMKTSFTRAKEIADYYPGSDGAKMLTEILEIAEPEKSGSEEFLKQVKEVLDKYDV
jgi:predicted dehydrogenase